MLLFCEGLGRRRPCFVRPTVVAVSSRVGRRPHRAVLCVCQVGDSLRRARGPSAAVAGCAAAEDGSNRDSRIDRASASASGSPTMSPSEDHDDNE
jgi:hypothetical protein